MAPFCPSGPRKAGVETKLQATFSIPCSPRSITGSREGSAGVLLPSHGADLQVPVYVGSPPHLHPAQRALRLKGSERQGLRRNPDVKGLPYTVWIRYPGAPTYITYGKNWRKPMLPARSARILSALPLMLSLHPSKSPPSSSPFPINYFVQITQLPGLHHEATPLLSPIY